MTKSAAPVSPEEIDRCRRCDLWMHATHGVPGTGPPHAAIMIVGEQPGDQEDRRAAPFVGPAGQVLDRALILAGLERAAVYLTNAVKHFKFELRGKRRMHKTPGQREVAACHAWLEQEMERVQPSVVVALGSTALRAVFLASGEGTPTLSCARGRVLRVGEQAVVATWHTSYVLRLRGEDEREAVFADIAAALRLAKDFCCGVGKA